MCHRRGWHLAALSIGGGGGVEAALHKYVTVDRLTGLFGLRLIGYKKRAVLTTLVSNTAIPVTKINHRFSST